VTDPSARVVTAFEEDSLGDLSWSQLARELSPGNAPGLLRVLSQCREVGRHVRESELRLCLSDGHLLEAQRLLLDEVLGSRSCFSAASNAASTGVLLVVGECGEGVAGEGWRAVLEPAIPVWIRIRPEREAAASGRTRIQAPGLCLTDEFKAAIESAVQAARAATGQFRESVVVEVESLCPLPTVGGRSHGLPVFLLAAFYFRYRIGLPSWLASTGRLEGGYVCEVKGVSEKASLAKRMGAQALLLPEACGAEVAVGNLCVEGVPRTEPADAVLARAERLVFARDASYLRLSLAEFQSRLAWIERVLVDQRRDHDSALQELNALSSVTAKFPRRYPNEAVYLLELKARIFSREGRSAEGVLAVGELRECVQETRSEHTLDLRHQWVWSDLQNRHANIWLYAYDFATALAMAEEALAGFLALRENGLASDADVARVKGTLGHAHLYSARVSEERDSHLDQAERLFVEAFEAIDEADAPRNENHLGFLALERDEPSEALRRFRNHIQEDVADRLSRNLSHTLWGLARCAHALATSGRGAESRSIVEEVRGHLGVAVGLGRCRINGYPEVMIKRYLGRALAASGLVEEGVRELVQAATFFPDKNPPKGCAAAPLAAACRLDLAHVVLTSGGDPTCASEALQGALRQLLAFGASDAVPGHDPLAAGRKYLAPLVGAVEATLAGLENADLGLLRSGIDRIPW
jgi:hypothetical protein